jgi:hypothetical protein
MTVPKTISVFSGILALVLTVALFFFVFNPLGLGPEPATVLSPEFFANPAQDLSEIELLVDGKEAFNEIFAAIDSAESSVYIQTYIWKDDRTGQAVVAKLKAAADRGVRVTVSKDMLGTFFERDRNAFQARSADETPGCYREIRLVMIPNPEGNKFRRKQSGTTPKWVKYGLDCNKILNSARLSTTGYLSRR